MGLLMNILFLVCVVGCIGQDLNTPAIITENDSETTPFVVLDNDATTPAITTIIIPVTPDNTTTTTTTTSPAPTSAPITIAPKPAGDEFYRVTENNVTCVMFSGDIKFNINYPTTLKKNGNVEISLPSPKDEKENVNSTGSCGDAEGLQSITVNWGSSNTRSSYTLMFNSTGDKWQMISTDASLYVDNNVFANATDAGKFLKVNGTYPGISFVSVAANSSFTCHASIDSKNFTAQVLESNSTYTVTSSAIGFKGQAFNSIPNVTDLQEGDRCEADMTSDLVPIAVGCALAGLVVLVLISYLVGRRRRSAAYQSV